MGRTGSMERATAETAITAWVDLDGEGNAQVETGNGFVNHMVSSLARHSLIDIRLNAESKDGILHHTIEDAAITLGMALRQAMGQRDGIMRFGHAIIPMDESLAECAVDLVRRPHHTIRLGLDGSVEDVPREDILHFFGSLLSNMEACIHLRVTYGSNDHHKAEAAAKALAVALRGALGPDPRRRGAASTKGVM